MYRGAQFTFTNKRHLLTKREGAAMNIRRFGVGILLLTATMTVIGGANDAHASDGIAATPEDQGSRALEEIVVTAQRRAEKLQDVPLTVTAISGQNLEAAGVRSALDLQSVVSGLTISGLGTVTQPAIRGVSTNISANGAENPIALYVDGVYQFNQSSLNENLPDLSQLEVLKGPQGTLFGRNATGGAIMITTKAPSFTPGGDFTVEPSYFTGSGGSHDSDRENVRGFITGPLVSDLLAGSLAAGFDRVGGYLTNDATGESDGRIEKFNGRAKLLFTPLPEAKIIWSGFYVRDDDAGLLDSVALPGLSAANYFPGSVVPNQPWHVAYDPGFFGATIKQYGTNINTQITLDAGTLTSISSYENTITDNFNAIAAAAGSPACIFSFACIDYTFLDRDREYAEDINFASKRWGIFSFTAGAFYMNAAGTTFASIQPTVVPGGLSVENYTFETKAYAGYGEATLALTERLSMILGARYSYEPHDDASFPTNDFPTSIEVKRNFSNTTPRASLLFKLTDSLNLYATYSQGYKSGLTGVTNSTSNPPYAPVKPEELNSYETGVKFASDLVTMNTSAFYYAYKNKQEQTFTGIATIVENTGPIRIYGIDTDANFQLSRDFRFGANATWIPEAKYLDFPNASGQSTVFSIDCGGFCPGYRNVVTPTGTFDATGQRLIRTPEITLNGTLSYHHRLTGGDLDASATANFSSAYNNDETGIIRQAAYATLNAQTGFTPHGDHWRFGIFGRNLTNKSYLVNGLTSSSGFTAGYGAPRELGLTVRYMYGE